MDDGAQAWSHITSYDVIPVLVLPVQDVNPKSSAAL